MDLSALEQSFRGGGANPPLLGLLMRPLPEERHIYRNIRRTGCFTANHVTEEILREAHQTSARYPEEVSEFNACGLTPEFLGIDTAPYVNEATIKIGAAYRGEDEIAAKRRGKRIGLSVITFFTFVAAVNGLWMPALIGAALAMLDLRLFGAEWGQTMADARSLVSQLKNRGSKLEG